MISSYLYLQTRNRSIPVVLHSLIKTSIEFPTRIPLNLNLSWRSLVFFHFPSPLLRLSFFHYSFSVLCKLKFVMTLFSFTLGDFIYSHLKVSLLWLLLKFLLVYFSVVKVISINKVRTLPYVMVIRGKRLSSL